MNKQGNTYTLIYSSIMVVVVGALLAFTYLSLKPKQDENIAADKMGQILTAVHIAPTGKTDVISTYKKYIVKAYIIDATGKTIGKDSTSDGEAFKVDMAAESKVDIAKRKLPVFVCKTDNNELKYILPAYGAGLWGPIWGYIAINADGNSVYGAYFGNQGETPGLGAEISKPEFQQEFKDKKLYPNGTFKPIAVVKHGQKPADPTADYVDGITGGTLTSKGVDKMLSTYLSAYEPLIKSLHSATSK